MNIPVQKVIIKIEQQLNELKKEVDRGNERKVQEAATTIKAYCELLTEQGTSRTENSVPKVQHQSGTAAASVLTPPSSFPSSAKSEGSLLDF